MLPAPGGYGLHNRPPALSDRAGGLFLQTEQDGKTGSYLPSSAPQDAKRNRRFPPGTLIARRRANDCLHRQSASTNGQRPAARREAECRSARFRRMPAPCVRPVGSNTASAAYRGRNPTGGACVRCGAKRYSRQPAVRQPGSGSMDAEGITPCQQPTRQRSRRRVFSARRGTAGTNRPATSATTPCRRWPR